MKKSILLFTGILFTSLIAFNANGATGHGATHWGYSGNEGPSHWGDLNNNYSTCKTGQRQSPIDIRSTGSEKGEPIGIDFKNSPLKTLNNGHTIQVNHAANSYSMMPNGNYKLLQFHFHSPSENTLNGRQYDMEIHFVHKNAQGQLAVVGVFVEEGHSNPDIETLWNNLPSSVNHENVVNSISFNPAELLPKDGTYYYFQGSLTTPPCSENVQWHVMKTPLQASRAQIDKFVSIIGHNNRPVQASNHRTITEMNVGHNVLAAQMNSHSGGGSSHSGTPDYNNDSHSSSSSYNSTSGHAPASSTVSSSTEWISLTVIIIPLLIWVAFFVWKAENMKLMVKIIGMVATLLALIMIVAALGIIKLSNIGDDIRVISERDIPLTNIVTKVSMGQLEQSIWYERAVLAGETRNKKLLGQAEYEFKNISKRIEAVFNEGDLLAEEAISTAETELDQSEFRSVSSHLRDIASQHERFSEYVQQTFTLLNNGNLRDALQLSHKVEREAQRLNEEAVKFLENLERFTQDAAKRAEHHEESAIRSAIILTILSLIIGVFMGVFIIRAVLRQIGGEPKDIADVIQRIADGDLTVDIQGENGSATTGILNAMQGMVSQLRNVVNGVQVATDSITTSAEEIAQGNGDLSQRTEESASSLEETASSMEEMTSTVKQNADNTRQANQLAIGTREQAEKGGEVLGNAVNAMSEISDSSKKIADIIGVIDEIAFQTNLLALNAAVEAARAGEQGRGFAVVASEVRTLAGRSADAAKEIKVLINESVEKVEQGSELVDASGKTLEEIVTSVKKVTDIISEIAASSQEQANGIEQVNSAVMQMDEMTQQNAALVEEATAASRSMEEQAQGLNKQMGFFTVDNASTNRVTPPVKAKVVQNKPTPSTAPKAATARAPQPTRTAVVSNDSEWDEF